MSRITRVKAVPFGAGGTTDDFETFGSTAAGAADFSKDIAAIQATSAWANGWRDALISAKAPILQDMNGKMLVDSNLLCYLFQEGVAEYDASTTYYKGGVVKNLANSGYIEFYVSLVDANTGNALPARVSDSNWMFLYAINTTAQGLIIPGTITNNSAAAGDVGEYKESIGAVTSAGTSGNYDDGTSLSLTAGDWDVTALAEYDYNGGTWSEVELGISPNSGNSSLGLVQGSNWGTAQWANTSSAVLNVQLAVPSYRVSLSATTTYYLKRKFVYSLGAPKTLGCRLSARRVR